MAILLEAQNRVLFHGFLLQNIIIFSVINCIGSEPADNEGRGTDGRRQNKLRSLFEM